MTEQHTGDCEQHRDSRFNFTAFRRRLRCRQPPVFPSRGLHLLLLGSDTAWFCKGHKFISYKAVFVNVLDECELPGRSPEFQAKVPTVLHACAAVRTQLHSWENV